MKMIQKELEENPGDWEMLGYLGDEYFSAGDLDHGEKALRDSIARMPEEVEKDNFVRVELNFLKLLGILESRGDTPECTFMAVYEQAVQRIPEDGDFDYLTGRYYVAHGEYEKGEIYLRKALEKLEKNGAVYTPMILSGSVQKAYELLAGCYYNNGKLEECISSTIVLLKLDRYLMSTLFLMLSAFHLDEASGREGRTDARAVAGFLGQNLYDFSTLKDRLFVLKAAMKVKYESLIEIIRGMFTAEELQYVDQALSKEE